MDYGTEDSVIVDMNGIDNFRFAKSLEFKDEIIRKIVKKLNILEKNKKYFRFGCSGANKTGNHPGGEVFEQMLLDSNDGSGISQSVSGYLPKGQEYSKSISLYGENNDYLREDRIVYSHTAFLKECNFKNSTSLYLNIEVEDDNISLLDLTTEITITIFVMRQVWDILLKDYTNSVRRSSMEIKKLREETEKEEQDIERAAEEIAGLSEYREDLKRLGDYYRLRSEKYEVIGDIPETDRTFVVSGYIDERHVAAVEKAIGDKYDCEIDVEDIPEDEDVPTVLKNNRFSSSMEGVVQSYGLPGRHEFDPTTIMSFFYVFFFGLMLSDAAYGLVMTIACAVLLWKYKRMDEGMRKQLKLFMFCGMSTTFWGVMFGGYFGDVITVVAETFFHKTVTVPALWFVPLEDPMRLLIWCLAFGIVHLFVGLAIKGYEELRDGKTLDFFCDVVLWYVFLIGLLMMLIPSEIFKSISQIDISFPPAVNMVAKVLAAGGALGLVLMSGRDHKNPVLRLALGLYDVYGVTSWLSDVLSYSRLLALGLATGVIASVVNQMGSMAGGGVVGAILFIIVFLIGHSMNMAINILGAYVHTNRLQFVEFFGKFYDGGGRPLEPFEQDTKYVEVKEEM